MSENALRLQYLCQIARLYELHEAAEFFAQLLREELRR